MAKRSGNREVLGFVVESGIPVPGPSLNRGRNRKYPFYEMNPGESVFVGGVDATKFSGIVFQARRAIAQKTGKPRSFATRKVTENGVTGVRVWRVA